MTVAYTDLLQPKAARQSELQSKYQFRCSCTRCDAEPLGYVDQALQVRDLNFITLPSNNILRLSVLGNL